MHTSMSAKFMACFLLMGVIASINAVQITLYENNWQQGRSVDMNVNNGCSNIPSSMNDRASSINTHGGCVILCVNANCQGRCEIIGPGVGSNILDHGNFGGGGFNDLASSAKPC